MPAPVFRWLAVLYALFGAAIALVWATGIELPQWMSDAATLLAPLNWAGLIWLGWMLRDSRGR
jgi:hypothetical protein